MNITEIRDHLRQRLARIDGLETPPFVPRKPEVPCAIIHPERIDPHADLEGDATLVFRVQILVQFADQDAAQAALDAFASSGPMSVVDALELGDGGSENVTVTLIEGYGRVEIGDSVYGTVTFLAEVLP